MSSSTQAFGIYMKSFFSALRLIMLLVGSPVVARAQAATPTLRTYQGEYEGGRATYTYYLSAEGRRVRHGHFVTTRTKHGGSSFSSIRGGLSQLATIGTSSYRTDYRIEGSYAAGQRTGRWTTTKTSIATTNSLRTGPVNTIDQRITTSHTYQNGQLDGPASYTDVPWRAGKPGLPTEAASARQRTQSVAYKVKETLFGEVDEDAAARDTTITTTEYAAGSFRYDAAPALSDPAHRPQSVRGRFDAAGYCDSTWTLRYWKGPQELNDASAVQKAQGWMTTVLEFSHGILRRERTTQASTGEVIHQFALPLGATGRRQLVSTPAHLYDFSPSDNNRPETPDDDWQSPLPEEDDASHYFFVEATRPLGPPRLLNLSYRLVPTTADSALLSQCETVLAQAHAQWQARYGTNHPPASHDTSGVAFRNGYLHLYDLLAATHPLKLAGAAPAEDGEEDMLAAIDRRALPEDATGRTNDNPYPWLRELTEAPQPGPPDEQQLVAHLAAIRQQLARVQAQLGAATLAPVSAIK